MDTSQTQDRFFSDIVKVVAEFVCNKLQEEKFPCPEQIHIHMTGFLTDPQAQQFMDELWALSISAEESENGIPAVCLEPKSHKIAAKVGKEQKQQLPQVSSTSSFNSNEICKSNNEDNKNAPIMETSASYLHSESRLSYRSSSKYSNYKRRASRSVSFTPSPERPQHKRQCGYNRDSSVSSLQRDSGRLQGGRRDDSCSRASGFEYNRYRPHSPGRYDSYNRQELRSRQTSRSRQYSLSRNRLRSSRRSRSRFRERSFSRNHSRSPRRSRCQRRSCSRFRRRSLSRNRSRSPIRINRHRLPLGKFLANNQRHLNRGNCKRQSREHISGPINRYDQQRRFSRERRNSPQRNQFCRNSPQWRDSSQKLSPERRSDLQEQNIFSPLQVSTPKHKNSTCNSWDQTKNSVVIDYNQAIDSEAEKQYLARKKRKKSKHTKDDCSSEDESNKRRTHKKRSSKTGSKKYKEEDKERNILDRKDDDNMKSTKSELFCTESIM